MQQSPPIAFVLSGGAALGAAQVGMLQATLERNIRPDLLIGTSIGAWNALWLTLHPDAPDVAPLASLWKRASFLRLFGGNAFSVLPRLIKNQNYLLSNRGIRHLLQQILPHQDLDALTFADLPIPLKVNATYIMEGVSTTFERGPLLPAILASSAIPGLFPPIMIEGHQYVDGGILDNGGVSVAMAAIATRIYVMSVAYGGALPAPIPTVLGLMDRSFHLIASRHVQQAIQHYRDQAEFIVIEDERINEGRLLGLDLNRFDGVEEEPSGPFRTIRSDHERQTSTNLHRHLQARSRTIGAEQWQKRSTNCERLRRIGFCLSSWVREQRTQPTEAYQQMLTARLQDVDERSQFTDNLASFAFQGWAQRNS